MAFWGKRVFYPIFKKILQKTNKVNVKTAHLSPAKHRLLALIFGITLMIPSLMQLEHIADGHSHLGCSQNTTHLHELDHGCDLLAFHFSAASINIVEPDFNVALETLSAANFWSNNLFKHKRPSTQSSRGPPVMI